MTDRFDEIIDPADPILDSFWLPLYRRAFPADERVPEDDHRRAAAVPYQRLLVGYDGDEPVSMARYDLARSDEGGTYGYLMYMAVDESAVSRGHGQQIFGAIVRNLASDSAGARLLIFEVQRPDISAATERHQLADRRIDFYRGQGAWIIEGVEYTQRVAGQPPVPMLLMVRPIVDNVTRDEAIRAAVEMFGDDILQATTQGASGDEA